jgi:hypothetical protein
MPGRTDLPRLSESQICEIAGCSLQRRQHWVKRGLLKAAAASGCGLRDALALAQLLRLIDVLGPTDGVLAWSQVRDRVGQPFGAEVVDVLYDMQLKTAVVAGQATDVRRAIIHGRPVRLVELGPRRAEITEAFRRVGQATAAAPPSSRQRSRTRRAKPRRAPGDAG